MGGGGRRVGAGECVRMRGRRRAANGGVAGAVLHPMRSRPTARVISVASRPGSGPSVQPGATVGCLARPRRVPVASPPRPRPAARDRWPRGTAASSHDALALNPIARFRHAPFARKPPQRPRPQGFAPPYLVTLALPLAAGQSPICVCGLRCTAPVLALALFSTRFRFSLERRSWSCQHRHVNTSPAVLLLFVTVL